MSKRSKSKKKAPRLNVSSDGKDPPMTVETQTREPQVVDLRDALIVPPVHRLMTDSQAILGNELTNLLTKSQRNTGLQPKETMQFARYVRALVDLSREEREQQKLDDIDRMTDDELITMLLENPEILSRLRLAIAGRGGE